MLLKIDLTVIHTVIQLKLESRTAVLKGLITQYYTLVITCNTLNNTFLNVVIGQNIINVQL